MKDKETEACAWTAATYAESYTAVVKALERKYDWPRAKLSAPFQIFPYTPMKRDYTHHAMEELVKQFNQLRRGMIHYKG